MPVWRIAMAVSIVLMLTTGLHLYLYRRLFRDTGLSAKQRRWGAVVLIALAVAVVGGMAVSRFVPRSVSVVLGYGSFVWMGLLLFLVPTLWVLDLVRFGRRLGPGAQSPERRLAMARGAAVLSSIGAVGAAGASMRTASMAPVLREIEVKFEGLPPELDGFRIAQLSDVHLGPTIGGAYLSAVVARINALKPDLVAITGDLVDGTVRQLTDDAAPIADLKSTHGSFFVTGNHEYYSGADAWIAEVERRGVRVLRNERVTVAHEGAEFDLLGVDDWRAATFGGGHGHDLKKACADRDPSRFGVLLAHQPNVVHEATEAQLDLVLCGHTHGGQIWPVNYLVKLVAPYVYGLHQHSPRTWIYVHAGTGYWGPPMRLKTRSEIVLLVLRRA